MATLAIGYADGVPRSMADVGYVLISGRHYAVAGRVTMDMTMVDVSTARAIPRVGDVAVLVGGDGEQAISIDEFASWRDDLI